MILHLAPFPTPPGYEPPVEVPMTRAWELPDLATWLEANAEAVSVVVTHSFLGFDPTLWDALPGLRTIVNFGVGLEKIDLQEAARRGVEVKATTDALTDDVADLAILLTMSLLRQTVAGHELVRSGRWGEKNLPLGKSLRGARLGVAGLGRIGAGVAARAAVLGMEVAYYARREAASTPYRFLQTLDALAEWADVLIVTLPETAETRRLVNAQVFKALGPQGYFVNVARGPIVDENDLLAALDAGDIAGAALDVFDNEPAIDPRWRTAPRAVLTPHLGSATNQARRRMADEVYHAAHKALRG